MLIRNHIIKQMFAALVLAQLCTVLCFKVAVIGSGIGGALVTHYLSNYNVTITVYEQHAFVGGRVHEEYFGGLMVETGGAAIHSSNKYMLEIIPRLGLTYSNEVEVYSSSRNSIPLGIWDGTFFRIRASSNQIVNGFKLLWRYGLSFLTARRLAISAVNKFVHVYRLLETGVGFSSPRILFETLGLYNLTQTSSSAYFMHNGISDLFINEFADGISRINYGQGSAINAFANLVSLAGAGMVGSLTSVKEGNSEVASRIFKSTDIRVNSTVRRIDKGTTHQYSIYTPTDYEEFDIVVIATPLEQASITFGFALDNIARQFVTTHVTFIDGILSGEYFGMSDIPDTIMTLDNKSIPFRSISIHGDSSSGYSKIYKIFSDQALEKHLLKRLFSLALLDVRRFVYQAYPVLKPMEIWPKFVMHDGLYYINAIESAASCMETQAIAARNVANLILNQVRTQ